MKNCNRCSETTFAEEPFVAILRGISPSEIRGVAEALLVAGVRIIEVPLNSPDALESVRLLRSVVGEFGVVGAGTVLSADEVDQVADAGGQLVVSPNLNKAVIEATKRRGLLSLPGVATVSEAFSALSAGADALKLFPATQVGPAGVKSWRSVLPLGTKLIAVGGVNLDNVRAWRDAGCTAVGLGEALYVPGRKVEDIGLVAGKVLRQWRND